MKSFFVFFMTLMAGVVLFPSLAQAEAPDKITVKKTVEQDRELKFTLSLRDGSHLVCTVPQATVIPLQTDFGKIEIPLRLVRAIQFNEDQKTSKTMLHNGDQLSGNLDLHGVKVNTSFGSISIPTAVLVRYEASAAPLQVGSESENAAQIATKDAKPVALQESDDKKGWRTVPGFLKGAQIYDQWLRPTNGIMEFKVTQSGIVHLACHFGYEGNSSGGWKENALTKEQFLQKGWKQVAEMRAGSGRIFTILRKPCGAGENFILRCNKYESPTVVLLVNRKKLSGI